MGAAAVTWFDNGNRIGALLLLVFAIAYLRQAFSIPLDPTASEAFTPRTLPIGLASAMIVLACVQLLLPQAGSEGLVASLRGFRWRPAAALVVLMLAYALGFAWLGFAVASFLFLLLGFRALGETRLVVGVAIAGGLVLFLWVMLTQAFGLYIDNGALLRWLVGRAT